MSRGPRYMYFQARLPSAPARQTIKSPSQRDASGALAERPTPQRFPRTASRHATHRVVQERLAATVRAVGSWVKCCQLPSLERIILNLKTTGTAPEPIYRAKILPLIRHQHLTVTGSRTEAARRPCWQSSSVPWLGPLRTSEQGYAAQSALGGQGGRSAVS
jgi:hypothetical protein